MNRITFILLMCIGTFYQNISAQNLELEVGMGTHFSKVNFEHDFPLNEGKTTEYQTYNNANFNISLTGQLTESSWHLRSDLGFIKTNTFMNLIFNVDEGFGKTKILKLGYHTNQKMYLGILPEYRYSYNSFSTKINFGVLFTSDISNVSSTTNNVLLPKSSPLGIKIGCGVQYLINRIGFSLNGSYMKIGESELENRYYPKVKYDLILINFGIVYSL